MANSTDINNKRQLIDRLVTICSKDDFDTFVSELSGTLDQMSFEDVLRLRGDILTECENLTFLGHLIEIFEDERRVRSVTPKRPHPAEDPVTVSHWHP
jgi:hypothetical protein